MDDPTKKVSKTKMRLDERAAYVMEEFRKRVEQGEVRILRVDELTPEQRQQYAPLLGES